MSAGPELSLISDAITLGVGGLVAVLVLIWKRADDKAHAETLEKIVERQDRREERLMEIVSSNTEAMRKLQSAVTALASLDRIEERLAAIEHEQLRAAQ